MARLAALVCAAYVALPGARAASSHAGLCDAINVCELAMFDARCPPGMELVAPPTRSDAYTLRTSDAADAAEDASTYTPGTFLDLHLRVVEPALRYCGLLLYAVRAGEGESDEDGNLIEARVGSWDARVEPDHFQASPVCGEEAVTHKHAAPKRLHHTFRFLAPEAGAGRLAFRLLLKYGETQGGAFYWPMTAGDLELDEATAAADDAAAADGAVWLRADVRPSDDEDDGAYFATCAERCEAAGGECDDGALAEAMGSAEALDAALSSQLTCRAPLLMGCATGADAEANCFYEGALDCDDDDDDESPCDVPLTRARFFGADAAEFDDASFLCPCTGETLVADDDAFGNPSAGGGMPIATSDDDDAFLQGDDDGEDDDAGDARDAGDAEDSAEELFMGLTLPAAAGAAIALLLCVCLCFCCVGRMRARRRRGLSEAMVKQSVQSERLDIRSQRFAATNPMPKPKRPPRRRPPPEPASALV